MLWWSGNDCNIIRWWVSDPGLKVLTHLNIILRIRCPMLLHMLLVLFLVFPAFETHMMKPSLSHNTRDHQDKQPQKSPDPNHPPRQHHLHHFTTNQKGNIVQIFNNHPPPQQKTTSAPDSPQEHQQITHQQINPRRGQLSGQQHNYLKGNAQSESNLEDRTDNHHDNEGNAFQKLKSGNRDSSTLRSKGMVNEGELSSQQSSEFINHEEKTLYLKFLEAIKRLMRVFTSTQTQVTPIDKENNQTLESAANSAAQLNASVVSSKQESSNISNSQMIDSHISATIKSFEVDRSSKLMNDTQSMVKKRKKLYFIICTLSFGATCILLIKLLEEREEGRKAERSGALKVPEEEFYIQQI